MISGPDSITDLKSANLWVSVFAEFIGTALLNIFSFGTEMIRANATVNQMPASEVLQPSPDHVLGVALCYGFSVASIVWSIGNVSGGHINPAVSWGLMVTRRITIARGCIYIVAQTVGGIVGVAILRGLLPGTVYNIHPVAKYSEAQVLGAELIATLLIVLVCCSSVDARRTDLAGSIPLTIGLVVSVGYFFAQPISGAALNPARAFGPSVIFPNWKMHWVYWIGPLVGATLAAWFYEFVLSTSARRQKIRNCFSPDYDPDAVEAT